MHEQVADPAEPVDLDHLGNVTECDAIGVNWLWVTFVRMNAVSG